MYTGTMIEDLISSVQQAEAHAETSERKTLPLPVDLLATYSPEFTHEHEELRGVA